MWFERLQGKISGKDLSYLVSSENKLFQRGFTSQGGIATSDISTRIKFVKQNKML